MPLALLSLSSPDSPVAFEAGPLAPSYHGLFIAMGILAGTWLTSRELARRGYDGALALGLLFFVAPLGLVGARAYHVLTEHDRYFGGPLAAFFRVWLGGFGIYGAIAGGFLGLLVFARIFNARPLMLADAAAPGLILAQAVGRWGNYFNQELFGRPSDLPWAIDIAPQNRLEEFADATSFHPAFLYESVWNLLVCLALLWVARLALLWVARRFADRLRAGDLFLLYVALYSLGRFLVETVRIDASFIIGSSVHANLALSAVLALGLAAVLLLRHSPRKSRT